MPNSQKFLTGVTVASTILALPLTAQAASLSLSATLDAAQEVPTPTIPVGLNPSGSAAMTFDNDSNELSWDISFSDLSGAAILAHFHGPATPGDTAPVQVDIGAISGLSSPLSGATILSDQQESELLAGLWYINIHTQLNPSGEIRGQVQVVATPEPSSLGFIALAGMSLLGYGCHRHRKNHSSTI